MHCNSDIRKSYSITLLSVIHEKTLEHHLSFNITVLKAYKMILHCTQISLLQGLPFHLHEHIASENSAICILFPSD